MPIELNDPGLYQNLEILTSNYIFIKFLWKTDLWTMEKREATLHVNCRHTCLRWSRLNVTKRNQDHRSLFQNLTACYSHMGGLKNILCLDASPSESDSTALGCVLSTRSLQTFPGASNMYQEQEQVFWSSGSLPAGEPGFLDRVPSLPLRNVLILVLVPFSCLLAFVPLRNFCLSSLKVN